MLLSRKSGFAAQQQRLGQRCAPHQLACNIRQHHRYSQRNWSAHTLARLLTQCCDPETRNGSRTACRATQELVYTTGTDVRRGCLMIIGVGARGSSAITQLQDDKDAQGAEFWAIDADGKAQQVPQGVQQLLVPPGADLLQQSDLQRICPVNAAAAAAGAASGVLSCTSGIAFIIAGASAIPGGSPLLLQLAAHLRRQGMFVVTELTMPFDFEGRRKLEEADALVEALAGVAQLTVLVSQEVLCRAYSALKVNEASTISDTTLVYIARSILWAVSAPEVLIAAPGGMTWHGRDLRQYRRLLAPPLERLLTCPGTAALGRGQASIRWEAAKAAPLASTLSTLAEDSVHAAADSPFLESAISSCGAMLVILTIPAAALVVEGEQRPTQALDDPEKYALRAAVQVAAMTALEVAGPQCQDVVVCAHVAPPQQTEPGQDDLAIEATMLVLEDPAVAEERASQKGRPGTTTVRSSSSSKGLPLRGAVSHGTHVLEQQSYPYFTPEARPSRSSTPQAAAGSGGRRGRSSTSSLPAAAAGGVGGDGSPAAVAAGSGSKEDAGGPPARPRSMWSAMSAIAGGSAAAAVNIRQRSGGATRSYRDASPSNRPPAAASGGGPGTASTSGRQRDSSSDAGPPTSGSGRQWTTSLPLPQRSPAAPAASGAGDAGEGRDGAAATGTWQHVPWQVDRMDQRLTRSLVAQSLDLPPTAARWRQQARSAREAEMGPSAPTPRKSWSFLGLAAVQEPRIEGQEVQDVRGRVAGMLQAERAGMGGWASASYAEEEE